MAHNRSEQPEMAETTVESGDSGSGGNRETEAHSVNTRLGLRLFGVYTVFYAGFVLVNAFAAEWSDWQPIAGINLAILWGFALIVLAFVLALLYGVLCRTESPAPRPEADVQESSS